jgi:hypothetical protein
MTLIERAIEGDPAAVEQLMKENPEAVQRLLADALNHDDNAAPALPADCEDGERWDGMS